MGCWEKFFSTRNSCIIYYMSLVENGAKWISTNTGNLLHRNRILHHDIPFLDTKKIWVKIVSAFVILFNILNPSNGYIGTRFKIASNTFVFTIILLAFICINFLCR